MAILFPPRSLQANERFDYWNAVMSSTFGLTTNRALSDTPFDGALTAKKLGDTLLTRVTSAPIEYKRKHEGGDDDHFFLCLTLTTKAELEQSGRQSTQCRGDIVLFNSADPYLYRFPHGDDQIVLSIPRTRLINHLPKPELLVSRTLASQSTLARLAGNMMVELCNTAAPQLRVGERLSGALLEVLSTAFEDAFDLADLTHSARHYAQLMKAKRFLLDNLEDASLDMTSIAQAVHMSTRALSRLFAIEGTTAIRWLWQQRLHACHSALLKRHHRSISEVALSFGFTNMTHFSRAFKATYGVSPSVMSKNTN
jgi:AraC family transcriptional activator of tynA and feaB